MPPFAAVRACPGSLRCCSGHLFATFRRVSLDFEARKVRFQLRKCGSTGVEADHVSGADPRRLSTTDIGLSEVRLRVPLTACFTEVHIRLEPRACPRQPMNTPTLRTVNGERKELQQWSPTSIPRRFGGCCHACRRRAGRRPALARDFGERSPSLPSAAATPTSFACQARRATTRCGFASSAARSRCAMLSSLPQRRPPGHHIPARRTRSTCTRNLDLRGNFRDINAVRLSYAPLERGWTASSSASRCVN